MRLTKLVSILVFTLYGFSGFAQKKELQSISESDLKAHLEFIAGDLMQGRDFNTAIPGLDITADYLKAQSVKMGLTPGAENYFQNFEMVSIKPDAENTFVRIADNKNNTVYENRDVIAFVDSPGTEMVSGDVLFCGYGYHNDSNGYNDFEGLELKDKIVIVMTRTPEIVRDTSKQEYDPNLEMAKMGPIFKRGAKALLLVPDPLNPDKSWFEMAKSYIERGTMILKGGKGRSFIPGKLIFGTTELANVLVSESGKTLLELQEEINNSNQPKSFAVTEVSAEFQLAKSSIHVGGKNVIGMIEGSDPLLKKECIVFTAHYDHVGMTPDGEIYNGADDNGTGTVALLEIAEAFGKLKKKPKRSIVFAWVTAEEKGLIGSDFYSQNPVIPLEQTLANINLDMVGRSAEKEPTKEAGVNKSLAGPNGVYIISGGQSSELNEISDKACAELELVPSDALTKAFLTRSDYYHFYKNGIPILGVSTGLHPEYHTIGDVLNKIDYNKMKRITQYCFLVAYEVANKKKRIEVDNPVSK